MEMERVNINDRFTNIVMPCGKLTEYNAYVLWSDRDGKQQFVAMFEFCIDTDTDYAWPWANVLWFYFVVSFALQFSRRLIHYIPLLIVQVCIVNMVAFYSQSSVYIAANTLYKCSTCKLMHNNRTNWFPFFLFLSTETSTSVCSHTD